MSALLQVEHIEKSFGETKVLRDVSFSLEKEKWYLSSVPPEAEKQPCVVA